MVQLHDLEFEPFISGEKIEDSIHSMSEKLNRDYQNEVPVFLGILNGAFMVASDLLKKYKGDCEIAFVKLGSYEGTATTGKVNTLLGLNFPLKGRRVIVVEDIVDTGNTLAAIDEILHQEEVADYKIATLFFKPQAYLQNFPIDYIGLEISNDFIVGFGLDYDGLGRNLTEVYKLKK